MLAQFFIAKQHRNRVKQSEFTGHIIPHLGQQRKVDSTALLSHGITRWHMAPEALCAARQGIAFTLGDT